MKVYWKVHINNFDSFIDYILERYKYFKNIRDLSYFKSYYNNDYLYLLIDISDMMNVDKYKYLLSYCYANNDDRKWLDNDGWKYMGEFFNRKRKLEVLNIISKL